MENVQDKCKHAIVTYKDGSRDSFVYLICKCIKTEMHFNCPDDSDKIINLANRKIKDVVLL